MGMPLYSEKVFETAENVHDFMVQAKTAGVGLESGMVATIVVEYIEGVADANNFNVEEFNEDVMLEFDNIVEG